MRAIHNLDSGGKLFSARSLDVKDLKELRKFASSRSIMIPTIYTNVDEIRTYLKLQVQFINEGISAGKLGGRNDGRMFSK